MTSPIQSNPPQMLPTLFGSLSLSLLRASAGPGGASAEIGSASLGVAQGAAGAETESPEGRGADGSLLAAEGRISAQTGAAAPEDRSLGEARERGLYRIRSRMRHLARALARLDRGVAIRSGATAASYSSAEAQASFASYGGNDALSVSARSLSRIYTGTGHDALALSAQRVEGVYTDVSPWGRGGGGNDAVAIRAGEVASVYTGGGNDALAIAAQTVRGIYSGSGSDAVSISAEIVRDIYTDPGPRARRAGGDDTVTLQARQVSSIHTGGGDDAVTIAAESVENVFTGKGDDAVTLSVGLLGGLYTGAGRDAISVDATAGRAQAPTTGDVPPTEGETAEDRLQAARSTVADINAGAGDDAISLKVTEAIALEAGRGDDAIRLNGGTVALRYGLGDGNDIVSLAPGAEVLVQLGADVADWSVTQEGDTLLLQIGEGSIRFEGVGASTAIGITRADDPEVELLHAQVPLDAVA